MFQLQPPQTRSTGLNISLDSLPPLPETIPSTLPTVSEIVQLHNPPIIEIPNGSTITQHIPSSWSLRTPQFCTPTDPPSVTLSLIGFPSTIPTNTMFEGSTIPCAGNSMAGFLDPLWGQDVERGDTFPWYPNLQSTSFVCDLGLTNNDTFMPYSNMSF